MRTTLKLAAAAALAIGFGASANQASAAADCGTITSINDWQAAGSVCDIGDKRFTLIDTDLDLTPYTNNFSVSFLNPGGLLTYSFLGNTPIVGQGDPLGDNEYVIYSVEVLDSDYRITKIQLDSNVVDSGSAVTTVTKEVFGSLGGTLLGTSVSTDGSVGAVINLSASFVVIKDTIDVGLNDVLSGFNNTITQSLTAVPEPMTLALFGAGLLGLGAAQRARRARA